MDPAARSWAPEAGPDALVARWAASGAMGLTGRAGGPALGPPAALVPALESRAAPFAGLDALALLGERAAVAGLHRRSPASCGGGCHLVRAADGWLAVSLPRPDDVDAVPAWLELPGPLTAAPAGTAAGGDSLAAGGDALAADRGVWAAVARAASGRPAADLVARGALLDLAVAALPAAPAPGRAAGPNAEADSPGPTGAPVRPGVLVRPLGPAAPRSPYPDRSDDPVDLSGLLVVDLSALWAGPLCTALLADAGASVVKVESPRRPDGARRGPPAFFDLLNGTKRSVALDLTRRDDRNRLVALLRRADVVVESSRPRALAQLGIDAAALVATGPPVWVSITGHGREGAAGTRIAFGDDAAVAGGLVAADAEGPVFCADAVADPLTGVAAARAAVDALRRGGRVLLDVALAAVAAEHAGPTLSVPPALAVAEPRVRPVMQRAPVLGADTATVLTELGIE